MVPPRTARIPKTQNARGHLHADILIPQRRVPRDEFFHQADALLVLHHLNRNAALPQQLFFSHERPVLAHNHAQWGEHLVSAWLGKNPRDLSTPPQSPAWRGPSWSVEMTVATAVPRTEYVAFLTFWELLLSRTLTGFTNTLSICHLGCEGSRFAAKLPQPV